MVPFFRPVAVWQQDFFLLQNRYGKDVRIRWIRATTTYAKYPTEQTPEKSLVLSLPASEPPVLRS